MTTLDMYNEVMTALGNRTDISSVGNRQRIINWLNWSQSEICGMHRKRLVPPKRFHALEGITYFSAYIEGPLQAQGGSSTTITMNGAAPLPDYTDTIVQITGYAINPVPAGLVGQVRRVKSFAGGTNVATVSAAWAVNPDLNTLYQVFRRKYTIGTLATDDIQVDPLNNLWAVERIEDADTGTPLAASDWEDLTGFDYKNYGTPSKFGRYGAAILLDLTPNVAENFRVFYYKTPTPLTVAGLGSNETSVLPLSWHEAIIDGAVYRGFRKLMEPDRAQEARATFIDTVVNRKTDVEFEETQKSKGFHVKMTR